MLTILGTFLIAFQRILPAIQQIYSGWAAIKSRLVSVNIILDVIEIEKEDEQLNSSKSNETINNSITLKDISFRFPGAQSNALEKINLDIIKGQSVGIIGTSGSGKSTLLDIIMGLLTPNSGKLIIDKKDLYASLKDKSDLLSWRSCLTHVPQDIFLLNTNILENIALGVNKNAIDMDLIKKVSKIAQIHDFIMTKRDNYFTLIGERGVLLSGGQRQRIGIARALYRNSQVIILDEATSALDSKTEESLMKSLFNSSRNLTIIMVAHRLTSLKNCDLLIKLEKGKITKTIKGNKDVRDYIEQQTLEYDSNKDKD